MAVEDGDDTQGDDPDGDGYPAALDLLSDGTRVAILRELARAEGPLRFAELRRRVGLRDSGTFNHHLSKLVGRFVRETDRGYALDRAGSRLIAAAGVADGAGDPDGGETDPVDGECPVCGDHDCERLYHVHLDMDTWCAGAPCECVTLSNQI